MITILNISDTKFSYNGIAYFKNFTPFVTGNKVSIVNTYDACISLTNFPTIYSDISIDGVTYGSVAALQNALLPVLFNRTFTQAGSLTVGYIPKATGINTLGNSAIYQNGSGNVVIGSTVAYDKLTLGGGKFYLSYAAGADIGGTIYSYNNTGYQPYAGGLKFQVFRNETGAYLMYDAMTLDAAGRLAIGTTNNIHDRLHIQNGSAANSTISIQSWGTEAAGEYAGIRFKSATTSNNEYGKGFIAFRNNGTGYGRGDLYFCLNNSTDTSNASTSDAKIVINASGYVGIGTTSPLSMLHAKASGYPTLTLEGAANSGAGIRFFGDVQYAEIFGEYQSSGNGQMFFRTRNAGTISTAMTILASGNVGIGTTSPGVSLEVNGLIRSIPVYNNTTATLPNLVVSSGGTFERSVASSIRYKENVQDWNQSGLDLICALKPRTFKYKKDYYDKTNIEFLGLIAEEVSEVSPYLADYENEDRTGEVANVRYSNIVVPLIKAIQELKAEIEILKN